jgi:hypothetical protein
VGAGAGAGGGAGGCGGGVGAFFAHAANPSTSTSVTAFNVTHLRSFIFSAPL